MAVKRREDAILQRLTGGFVLDASLHAYAEILFSRSRLVAVLLLLATALNPPLLVAGVLATVLAALVSLTLRFDAGSIREGFFGYNALLVALAGAATFEFNATAMLLLLAAILGSVLVTGALRTALGFNFNLPPLSLPFVFVAHLVLGAGPILGLELRGWPAGAPLWMPALPEPLSLYLRSLGAIFFLPRIDAGMLVGLALLLHSRIGVVLSLLGFGMAQLVGIQLVGVGEALPILIGFNFMLVAVALGGVWFVPSVASFLFAAAATLLCGLMLLGLTPVLGALGLPLLILPFNITVIFALYAMRQRVKDEAPKAVDFLLGSPEENLNYYRTRLARFGSRYLVRFSAPFRGRWVCTQGVDGPHTHRGQWREALDFEVEGPDGKVHRGLGRTPGDFLCYRLPILAPADGTVVRVVDGIRDNQIGELNLEDNWGNLVLLYHGPLIYTLHAHLAPGSIKVQEGQIVRRGDLLGLCGNSGRAPTPHLHFQIQATARVGAGTAAVELHDVVLEGDADPRLVATCVPEQGTALRNIEAHDDIARLFAFTLERPMRFRIERDGRVSEEVLTAEVDLYGNLLLRSDRDAVLFYERSNWLFTVYDVLGPRSSVLHLMQASLARVPFEGNPRLRWTDHVPLSRFAGWPIGWLQELVSPFVARRGLMMTYQLGWAGGRLVVDGLSDTTWRGQPAVQTRAELERDGIQRLEATLFGRKACAERIAGDDASAARPPDAPRDRS